MSRHSECNEPQLESHDSLLYVDSGDILCETDSHKCRTHSSTLTRGNFDYEGLSHPYYEMSVYILDNLSSTGRARYL